MSKVKNALPMVILVLLAAGFVAGCGGGGSSKSGSFPTATGKPQLLFFTVAG